MKLILLLALLLSVVSPNEAQAAEYEINGNSQYGCIDEDVYDKTISFVSQNDVEAFKQYLGNALNTGTCTMFRAGESVVMVENGLFKAKIRRKGNLVEYWVGKESVK